MRFPVELCASLLFVFAVLAQSDTASLTTTSSRTSTSRSNTITSASSTSTARGTGSRSTPTIQLPPLVQCSYATFTFTIPRVFAGLPKHLGFYPSSASSWIETVHLGTQYDDLTEGTFTWLVDLPVGLSVAAMFYVTQPENQGAIPQNGRASTSSIVAIASNFDPTFIWTGAQPTSSAGRAPSSGGNDDDGAVPAGAIVGAVIGGIALVTIVPVFLFCLRRRHNQRLAAARGDFDGYSTYSEKPNMWTTSAGLNGSVHGLPVSEPPPGTYWSQDETGNPILIAVAGSGLAGHSHGTPDGTHVTGAGDLSASEVDYMSQVHAGPRRIAPTGTLPEPMGDGDEEAVSHAEPIRTSTPPLASPSAFSPQAEPRTYRLPKSPHLRSNTLSPSPMSPRAESVLSNENSFRGAEGLDDPNSFAPK
ncbi:hypothetical protein ACM66B_006222 [Microbotryomycetes sp. NB124-2]